MIAALILVANLLVPQDAVAPRDSLLEAQVHQVGSKLRCPVCQGLSVAASPSAHDMREVIRSQLKAGKTPAEVEAYFVSKYGEWILLRPEPRGFNLALYILPTVMIVGGISLVFLLAKKWSRAGAKSDAIVRDQELEKGSEENAALTAGNGVDGG